MPANQTILRGRLGRTIIDLAIWTYSSKEEAEDPGFPDDGIPVQISYLCYVQFVVMCHILGGTHAILALMSGDFAVYAQVQDVGAAVISATLKYVHIKMGKSAVRDSLAFPLLHLISCLHLEGIEM